MIKKKSRITESFRIRILEKNHKNNEFVGMDFSNGEKKYYLIKCRECGLIKNKKTTQLRQRCSCNRNANRTLSQESIMTRLAPGLSFLRRNGKIIVCFCNKCKKEINKWVSTIHKPCRCSRVLSFDFVKKQIEKEGYRILFSEFLGANHKIKLICPKGHEWETKYGDFYTGYRCSTCNSFKNEKECREIIEKMFLKPFPKIKPKFLVNPKTGGRMEIDCFNKELKIGVEYNGPQHYLPFKLYGGEKTLKKTKYRDELKKKICEREGVTLITVSYRDKDKFQTITDQLRAAGKLP